MAFDSLRSEYSFITESEARNYEASTFRLNDVINSTRCFIEDTFGNAITFAEGEMQSGFVTISPYGFAYLIKAVLNEIYAKTLSRAQIGTSDGSVFISLAYNSPNQSLEKLESIALSSGFSISTQIPGEIRFYTKILPSSKISLYARGKDLLRIYFNEVFFF